MAKEIMYLSAEEVTEFNVLVLGLLRVKKSDAHKVLSRKKLVDALEKCRELEGDVYSKAARLMRELSSAHAFASGNRRTAFIATKEFVQRNGVRFSIPDDPDYAKVMRGIREGKYQDAEIAEWIANGKIKQRER
jgi:death-on-curing protein